MKQKGFTLIELIVVIVILGILAATAMPKFVDLSGDAEKAARQGLAGAINSACAINFAQVKAGTSGVTAISGLTAALAEVNLVGTITYTEGTNLIFTNPTSTTPCQATAS